jgi:hypothetical protein
MGTLEMVVSPAVYDYDPNKLGHQSQVLKLAQCTVKGS